MDFMLYWGQWIQSARKNKGYNSKDFAKAAHLSTNQVTNIENGRCDSRKETLDKVIAVLGDEKAFDAIVAYVELDIAEYIPLIRTLDRLPPEERQQGIQQILNMLT